MQWSTRLFLLSLSLIPALFSAAPAKAKENVDLELVLAVDISFSMDEYEQKLQRQGYVQALRSPEVIRAIRGGLTGRIAVTYVEWAGAAIQNVIVPWTLIDSAESAEALADRLAEAPITRLRRTSISGALLRSLELFQQSPYQGARQVIDVSGDGPNNDGPPVTSIRELVVGQGIIINGLPLLIYRGERGFFDIPHLDWYYEDCVIGGAGSFSLPVVGVEAFTSAIRTKLILEISDISSELAKKPRNAADGAPRVSCMIGEQMMRRLYGP